MFTEVSVVFLLEVFVLLLVWWVPLVLVSTFFFVSFFVGIFFSTETPVPTETPLLLPPRPNPVPTPKDVVQALAKNNDEIIKIRFF